MLKKVKIELTNKCSRNCKHCSSSATSDIRYLKELDFEHVSKIIKEAKLMGVETIIFTGGEPIMYKRLEELVQLTSSLGMNSTIYSFAWRNEETLVEYKKLIECGLNKIIYSLADSLSEEEELSTYMLEDFFDRVFDGNNCLLGFHYAVSKDSIGSLNNTINTTISLFDNKKYFDKISLLRFVPHGKGNNNMDLSKEELLSIRELYLNSNKKNRIRLGSPWNILGIENSPCIIADEIMIIGFDGVAYPCDSIKYFNELGISGNINENSLEQMYNSSYFTNIRNLNVSNSCSSCTQYNVCKSGCIGQKIIAYYSDTLDKQKALRYCINSRDPKCMR